MQKGLYSRYEEYISRPNSGSANTLDRVPIRKTANLPTIEIEIDQPTVEADQAQLYFNPLDSPEENKEKLKEHIKTTVKVLCTVGDKSREVIKEYINLMLLQKYHQNLSQLYQEICKFLKFIT